MNMKEKLQNFMIGRYGGDQFSRFLSIVVLVLCVISIFIPGHSLFLFCLILIGYCYFRMFSKNYAKRNAENIKYLKLKEKVMGIVSRQKNALEQSNTHHIYKCPKCKQKIRIPKGKGKVCITCPSCHTEFHKRS